MPSDHRKVQLDFSSDEEEVEYEVKKASGSKFSAEGVLVARTERKKQELENGGEDDPSKARMKKSISKVFQKADQAYDGDNDGSDGPTVGGGAGGGLVACGESELGEAFFKRLWSYLDQDGNGTVSKSEIAKMLKMVGEDPRKVDELWKNIHTSNSTMDDSISAEQFSKISRALKSEGADDSKLEALWRQVSTTDNNEITPKQFINIVTSVRERSFGGKLVLWNVQFVLMFLYTFTTRMPFIFLAPEIQARGGTLTQVGAVFGLYQACRATANTIVGLFGSKTGPGLLYIIMVSLGVAGWIGAALLANSGEWYVWFTFAGVGLSEVVVPLQVGLLAETRADSPLGLPMFKLVMDRLRAQYAAVAGGAFVAFFVSGWIYNGFGFATVCWVGAGINILQLLCGLIYLMSRERSHNTEGTTGQLLRRLVYKVSAIDTLAEKLVGADNKSALMDSNAMAAARANALQNQELQDSIIELFEELAGSKDKELDLEGIEKLLGGSQGKEASKEDARRVLWFLDRNGDGSCSKQEFLAFLLPHVQTSLNPKQNDVSPVYPYAYCVVVTQAIMAMCIGCFLSTSVLQYERLGIGVEVSGMLLAVGEGLGAVALMVTNCNWSRNIAKSWNDGGWTGKPIKTAIGVFCSRPFHVIPTLAIAGSATAIFGSPVLVIAICAQMVLSTLNDFTVSLLNEVTAGAVRNRAKYLKLQSFGQWLRRCGNILTGVTGPILFQIYPWLPWTLYGCVVFTWSMFLWSMFYRHSKVIGGKENRDANPFSAFRPFLDKSWFNREVEHAANTATLEDSVYEMDVESNLMWLKVEVNQLRQQLEAVEASKEPAKKSKKGDGSKTPSTD